MMDPACPAAAPAFKKNPAAGKKVFSKKLTVDKEAATKKIALDQVCEHDCLVSFSLV